MAATSVLAGAEVLGDSDWLTVVMAETRFVLHD